jgi:hypothetical protein
LTQFEQRCQRPARQPIHVKVRDSNLSGATDGPDFYAYADPGTVGSLTIDLGRPQDPGQNNLAGEVLPSVIAR